MFHADASAAILVDGKVAFAVAEERLNRHKHYGGFPSLAVKACLDAVGAKISVKTGTRTQTRVIQVGGGDASGHAGWIHVGLGTAERAEIRVQWPDGDRSAAYRVFANQFVVIDRTKPQAAYWYPGR